MIHTDFKPENVVISLRDDEIEEIHNTGQLTTTKMGKNDHIKNMNMKVAGTLKQKKNKSKDSPDKTNDTLSDCQSSNTNNEVWDQKLFEGLSAKQKKNLRKKLQRKRKQKNQSQTGQSIDLDGTSRKDGSDIQKGEIDDIDIDIGESSPKQKEEPK